MCEHLDREHFYRFARSYFELAVRNGTLYSAGDNHEGFFIFVTPETKGDLYGSLIQVKWMLRAFGFKKGVKYVKEIMDSGTYLASELRKEKKPFTKIEFIAVSKEHQGQGYMRKMIDCAFSESDRLELPCILTTDDEKKVKIYEHFGMKLESVSKFPKMHFRRISMHFSVAFPRFTASKSSSKRLELQADPLETALSSF